jgi:predicted CoA-binding protein
MISYDELEDDYSKYAHETYCATFGGEKVAELAEKLLADAGLTRVYGRSDELAGFADASGNKVGDHEVIMTVIDYLRQNNTYTLTPASPENTDESVLEAFLFDTKEGYCTHFATAASALLRYYGYPVRFCEGYIAKDLHPNYSEKVDAKYMTMVHDDCAHAWIEVYIDGYGWQQYETTPAYAEAMYDANYVIEQDKADPTFTPTEPAEQKPEKTHKELEDAPEETEEEKIDLVRLFVTLGIILVAVVIVAVSLKLVWEQMKKRAHKAAALRHEPVAEAMSDVRKFRSGEENRALALELNDQIMEIFAIAGFEPEDGEDAAAFSERVSDVFAGLSETPIEGVVDAMMRAEFGSELDAADLSVIGDFLDRLVPSVYSGLPPAKKIWWRYLKRKI